MANIRNFPNNPANGTERRFKNKTYTWNASKSKWGVTSISVDANPEFVANSVSEHLIPSANVAYDLGHSELAFRDLYLSGNSIFLGGQSITANSSGVSLPSGSRIGTQRLDQKYLQVAFDGTLSITTGTARFTLPRDYTLTSVEANLGTAADASVLSTINKNGSALTTITVGSSQTNASNTGLSVALSKDDYLTVDINSVGTTDKGSDLSITLTLE
jgi:hypothetical protein